MLSQPTFLGGLFVSLCLSWNYNPFNFLWCWAVYMHYLVRASQQACEIILLILILKMKPGLGGTDGIYLQTYRYMETCTETSDSNSRLIS